MAIHTEARDGYGVLTLDRQDRANAYDRSHLDALEAGFIELTASVHVVVIRAAGSGAFCGGADLNEMQTATPEDARNLRSQGMVFVSGSLLVLIMVILFVWSPWYMLSFTLLSIGGLGQAGFSTMQSAITMLAAPPEMRGRMMGVLSECIGIGTILGALEIGAVASALSIQWSVSANALVGLVLVLPVLALSALVGRSAGDPELALAED